MSFNNRTNDKYDDYSSETEDHKTDVDADESNEPINAPTFVRSYSSLRKSKNLKYYTNVSRSFRNRTIDLDAEDDDIGQHEPMRNSRYSTSYIDASCE